MSETVIVEAKLSKVTGHRDEVRASAKLHKLNGNDRPYFSLTGEELHNGRVESCGQITETLLRHWPELKPLSEIHLSDDTGMPMHAVANGWYWAGGNKEWCKGRTGDPPNVGYLANHLRIPLDVAQAIADRVKDGQLTQAGFAELVGTYAQRYQQEAQAAVELIKKLAEAT